MSSVTYSIPFSFSTVAIALFMHCGIAVAATTEVDDKKKEHPLERVEVTAQKRTQDLQDVPVALTVVSGTDIAESVSLDIYDLQGYVPAFQAFQSQSATNSSFSVRGIGTSSQNFGFESSVGLYVDGVYRSRQNAVINDLVDIDAVEILRGPQGTLFGKNTPAGAVVFRSKAPTFENGDGFVSGTLGSDNLYRLSGATSISLVDDRLAARVSGFTTQRDGWIDDVNLGKNTINNRDRSGVRLQALYTPNEDVSIRVIADYAELDEHCCGALTLQSNAIANDIAGKFGSDALLMMPPVSATLFGGESFYDYTTALSALPVSAMTDKGLSAEVNWQISDTLLVTSVSGWRSFDSLDTTDTDFTDADMLSTTNDAGQQAFSQELRATYSRDSVTLIGGLYYFSQNLGLNFDITTGEEFPLFFTASAAELMPLIEGINGLSAATGGLIAPAAAATPANTQLAHTAYQEQDSIAVFGQSDWQFAEHFTLTTGIRYTREEKTLVGRYTERGPGINGLPQDPALLPNPILAGSALGGIAQALASGNQPELSQLAALAPFQQAGWGYFFLGTASVLPRTALDESRKDNQITGTVKLSWQPDNDRLYYASVGTGFKSGGMNTDRIAEGLNPQFNAEKATAFEVGLKQDIDALNLRINAAAHHTRIDDFQASTFTGFGFNLQNAGDLSTKGFELEMIWFPTTDTRLGVNMARTLATFDKFEKGTCWVAYSWHTGIDDPGRPSTDAPYCSRTGDRLGFEPETTLGVNLEHTINIGAYSFLLALDYQYTGDLYLDDSNDPYKHVDSFDIVNARISMNIPQWDMDVTLWGRNVLDEEYIARNGFDVPVQAGKLMAYPGQPASYGITLRKAF